MTDPTTAWGGHPARALSWRTTKAFVDAALQPAPAADGGVATWHALDDNGAAEVRVNGQRITSMPSYAGAEEVADRINRALTAKAAPVGERSADMERMRAALTEARDAVAFFDKVKTSSQDEQIAVGRDHWNRLEAAIRAVAALGEA